MPVYNFGKNRDTLLEERQAQVPNPQRRTTDKL